MHQATELDGFAGAVNILNYHKSDLLCLKKKEMMQVPEEAVEGEVAAFIFEIMSKKEPGSPQCTPQGVPSWAWPI